MKLSTRNTSAIAATTAAMLLVMSACKLDISNPNAISLFVSGDQLLKGAALNAVQIAEHVLNLGQPAKHEQYA